MDEMIEFDFGFDGGLDARVIRDELRVRIGLLDARVKMISRVFEKFVDLRPEYLESVNYWNKVVVGREFRVGMFLARSQNKSATDVLKYWGMTKEFSETLAEFEQRGAKSRKYSMVETGFDLGSLSTGFEATGERKSLDWVLGWGAKNRGFTDSMGQAVLGLEMVKTMERYLSDKLTYFLYGGGGDFVEKGLDSNGEMVFEEVLEFEEGFSVADVAEGEDNGDEMVDVLVEMLAKEEAERSKRSRLEVSEDVE